METKIALFVLFLLLVNLYFILFTPYRMYNSEYVRKRNILATTQNPSMFNRWLDSA